MRDAVAEVLLERRALVARRSFSLLASAALHLLAAAALLLAGRRDVLRPPTSVLNIRLAPPPPAPPVTIETPAPMPAAPPVVAEEPKPQKTEKKLPTKKPVEKALFGKSKEKPVEKVPSPEIPAPSRTATQPGTTGVSGLEGGNFPYTIYIDRMLTLIGSHWLRPPTATNITAQLYFVIERDGTIRDVRVEKPSGSSAFDRAAFRAVIEASPLPPLPFAYSGTYLGVHLTFH